MQKIKKQNKEISPYLLMFPALFVIIIIVGLPIIASAIISMYNYMPHRPDLITFIGLQNYIKFFKSPFFWQVLGNTFIFAISSVFLSVLIGLLIALVLNNDFPGVGILKTCILIPWAIPSVSNGVIWKWIFHGTFGWLNAILVGLGLQKGYISYLSHPAIAMVAIIVAQAWKQSSIPIILILSGLQSIPKTLYEAAYVDGANSIYCFFNITLPLIRNVILVASIFLWMGALRAFDIIYVLTSGGPGKATSVIGWEIYERGFRLLKFGEASALGYIITTIIMISVIIYFQKTSRKELHY